MNMPAGKTYKKQNYCQDGKQVLPQFTTPARNCWQDIKMLFKLTDWSCVVRILWLCLEIQKIGLD